MTIWFISLRLFIVRSWFIVALAAGLVVNPVRILQLLGWLPHSYTLLLSPLQFQMLFGFFLLIALFIWFHRQRVAFDVVRPTHPTVMFTDMLRYVATKSRWASRDTGDDDWVNRLQEEVISALSLSRITAFGRMSSPYSEREIAPSPIPAEFWRKAWFSVFDIMNERSTQHTVHSTIQNGPAYTEVIFDHNQLRQAWTPRSGLARLTRSSPAEKRGNVKDWRQRDARLDSKEREIRDKLWKRLHEGDAREADRSTSTSTKGPK